MRYAGTLLIATSAEHALLIHQTTDPKIVEAERDEINESLKLLDEALARYRRAVTDYYEEPEGDLIAQLEKATQNLKVKSGVFLENENTVHAPNSGFEAAQSDFEQREDDFNQAINQAVQFEQDELSENQQAVRGELTNARWVTIIAVLAALGLAVGIGAGIARSITKPLDSLTAAASSVAQGDYSQPIPVKSDDELGHTSQAFNEMIGAIQKREKLLSQVVASLEQRSRDLEQAHRQAVEADRLKSEFLATTSHELRTPLNAIMEFSGILLEGIGGEIDERAHGMVEGIYNSSERLLALINNILDLARIEAGYMNITSRPMSLHKAIQDWQSQLEGLAVRKGLTIVSDLDKDLPDMMIGDKGRITQVVANLLSNAVKFTQRGSITLRVKWQAEQLQIAVSDTGIGIPPHALNYIFQSFRQVDGSFTRPYEGSGLGLSIAQNLSRIMGGEIQVDSVLNQGSTFTINLPLPLAPAEIN